MCAGEKENGSSVAIPILNALQMLGFQQNNLNNEKDSYSVSYDWVGLRK